MTDAGGRVGHKDEDLRDQLEIHFGLTVEPNACLARARLGIYRLEWQTARQRLESFCPGSKVDFVRPGVSRLRKDVDIGLGDCVRI
jgi:hypothetical protein